MIHPLAVEGEPEGRPPLGDCNLDLRCPVRCGFCNDVRNCLKVTAYQDWRRKHCSVNRTKIDILFGDDWSVCIVDRDEIDLIRLPLDHGFQPVGIAHERIASVILSSDCCKLN